MEKRFAKVVAGVVKHISVGDPTWSHPDWLPLDDVANADIGIDDLHDGNVFSKKPVPPKTPEQLAEEAALATALTEKTKAKAVAALTYLATHTNAEIRSFLENDVDVDSVTADPTVITCLAAIEKRLEDFAVGLAIILRREFK